MRDTHIDMKAIAEIESNGRMDAVGDNGRSLGAYQLQKGVIEEYNRCHKTAYRHEVAKTEAAREIAEWYANKRIPEMLKAFRVADTIENRLIAYNAGIKAAKDGPVPMSTHRYIRRYYDAVLSRNVV